ncbi:MAG: HD domain-containing protein [Acidobacteria bacterium]|nr:MAG: HD domain-containing protein [Acidobacteriota bacterium]
MTRRPWNPLRAWVLTVNTVGALVIVESLNSLQTTPHRYEWLLFAALTAVAGSFSLKIGSISARVTISDTFFITTALLFGPAPATLAVALGTLVSSWRRGHARERVAFNTSTCAFAIWAGSQVFFRLAGVPPLTQAQSPVAQLVAPLLALTAVYFLSNTALIAIAVALDTRRPVLAVWREHFLWLVATYFAAASVSFCLVLLMYEAGLAAAILVLPLLLVLHLTLRSSIGRLEDARSHLAHLDRLYLSTVETLAMAIDAKDDVTHSHVRRVQAYALGLARALGVNDEETLKAIEAAALLHDTGKLAVPEHILNKPGKLNEVEFEQMKRHVDVGADILSLVEFPYPVVPIVRCHHENWDGTGYPRGVVGTDIPIGARILSVVDCFDALTSDRPYRSALSDEQAFEVLRARRGTMYEPRVVDTFMRVHRDLAAQISEFQTHDALRQITRSVSAPVSAPPHPAVVTSGGVSDDVLAFVSLARLASGDASMNDVLALASNLMNGLAPGATTAWYTIDEGSGFLALRHAAGPAARQIGGTALRIGDGVSGWVASQRQVIVNSEASLDLGERAHLGSSLEYALSVPLITRESLVGTVTLYSPTAFSDNQSRLVQVIAPHLAQSVWTAGRNESATRAASASRSANAAAELRLVATR